VTGTVVVVVVIVVVVVVVGVVATMCRSYKLLARVRYNFARTV